MTQKGPRVITLRNIIERATLCDFHLMKLPLCNATRHTTAKIAPISHSVASGAGDAPFEDHAQKEPSLPFGSHQKKESEWYVHNRVAWSTIHVLQPQETPR
jgi:hypothetical protein